MDPINKNGATKQEIKRAREIEKKVSREYAEVLKKLDAGKSRAK